MKIIEVDCFGLAKRRIFFSQKTKKQYNLIHLAICGFLCEYKWYQAIQIGIHSSKLDPISLHIQEEAVLLPLKSNFLTSCNFT